LAVEPPPTQTGVAPNGSLNDLAFDEANGVYLHVFHGGTDVWGRFVAADGRTVGDRFWISTRKQSFASWTRVAYSTAGKAGLFLVTYSSDANLFDKSKNIFGQFVRFNGSGGELVGASFPISDASLNPQVFQEAGGIAYNHQTNQFLVTWTDSRGGWEVFARLINVDGSYGSPEANVSSWANWQGAPTPAYDWKTNRFLVVYGAEDPVFGDRLLGTYARVLDGATLAPVGGAVALNTGGFQDAQNVVYLPESGSFLAFWRDEQRGVGANVVGRLLTADGALASNVYPVIATPQFDGGADGDYNWVTRSVFIAAMHDTGYDYGVETDGTGAVRGAIFAATNMPLTKGGGSFWPRVITGASGQFGLSYMLNYAAAYVERYKGIVAGTPGPYPGTAPIPRPNPGDPTSIDLGNAPNGSSFFAEGVATTDASFNFNTYYQLQNSTDTPATVRAYFAKQVEGGGVLKERSIEVPARARKTVDLKGQVGDGSWSAVFQSQTAGVPIHAQQTVLWGSNFEGSSGEAAARESSTQWLFAEGSRKGPDYFANYFLLFNPLPQTIVVRGEYFLDGSSAPVTRDYSVLPSSRFTVDANHNMPELAGRDFSARFSSASGFVAQRAMYWGPNFLGGHSANGVTSGQPRWFFAEGAAAPNFDTYYTLLNPNAFDVDVTVTYYTQTGARPRPDGVKTLKANSRGTIHLNSELGNIGGTAALFTTSGAGIVVERSIYWGAYPGWVEGTNDTGINDASMMWFVPEGSNAGLFDTYILVANPNLFPVTVLVRFFLEGGGRISTAEVVVPAQTRWTINMNLPRGPNGESFVSFDDLGYLSNSSYGTSVESKTPNGPIVVEGAVYRDWRDSSYWRAGSSAFGIPQ
jgi:hypothetical protein